MPSFRLETDLAAPPERCFALSLSVDAHTASMGRTAERAVAGVTSGRLGPDDVVTWRARHFGLPFSMTVAITAYDEPHRFVDEQVRGPFGSWHHDHRFTATADGGTAMVDEVTFSSPMGLLGAAVDHVVLARYLRRLVGARNRWLAGEVRRSPSG